MKDKVYSVICYEKRLPLDFQHPKVVYVSAKSRFDARRLVESRKPNVVVDVVFCGVIGG